MEKNGLLKMHPVSKTIYRVIALGAFTLSAQFASAEEAAPISVTAQSTYGAYGGSAERTSLLSETVTFGYAAKEFGVSAAARNWKLSRISTLGNLSGIDTNLSLYAKNKLASGGYVATNLAATYLLGDDSNTSGKFVPYTAISYETPEGGQYFNVGYAYMGYSDTIANQLTATYGLALLDRYVWAQTRLYYNNLSNVVQGKGNTLAVEERLTWYVVPEIVSLTVSGMIGQRVYGYDPDLGIVYTLPDIQIGSGGVTATWNISPAIRLFADVTYESYEKRSISNSYNATYGTVGLTFNF
jgi:hypothetical protein